MNGSLKVKPTGHEALTYLAKWLLENNPNKPNIKHQLVDVDTVAENAKPAPKVPAIVWAFGGIFSCLVKH